VTLLEDCTTIEEVQLQNNQIQNDAGERLAAICHKRRLTKLDVDNNEI
jgi:hypothetical protein